MDRGGFVGREREMEQLLTGLDDAVSGQGSLFLLAGEPGIGKSRLAGELAAQARARGLRVLWGRCWEAGGAPAYWPWVQVLRSTIRGQDGATIRKQMGAGAVDIAQMLPEVRHLFPDLPSPPSVDPESARFQLFDSTATFLWNAAAAEPLVVLLEDLHAADTVSILLLRFLAGQVGDSHILMVATYRDVELTPDHPLTAALPQLDRGPASRRLLLGGLAETDVAAFVDAAAGPGHSSRLVSALFRETSGNPLFLREALQLLAAEGRLEDAATPASLRVAVPPGVRDVIGRRLGHLADGPRDAMSLASVLGTEFATEALRRLSGLAPDELLDRLDRAAQARLLVGVQGTLGRFRFSHGLVRETLYEELAPASRMRLHRRAAEALRDLYANDEEPHLAELAHHFFEAAPLGDASIAAAYARRAGEEAARSLAYEEAARLFGMAVETFQLDEPVDEERLSELLIALGDAQARVGDRAAAKQTFLRVAKSARRTGAAGQLARAALGYGGRLMWARAGDDPHVIPMLRDGLALLGERDDPLRVRLLVRLACALRSSPDRTHSDTLSRQAVEIARQLGDPTTLGFALAGRCWAIFWPENPQERLDLVTELVRIGAEANDTELMFEGHQAMGMCLLDLGAVAEGRAEMEAMARAAEELRQPAQRWAVWPLRTALALLEGDFDRAEELMTSEMRSGQGAILEEGISLESAHQAHRFLLLRERGRLGELVESTRAAVEQFPWYPFHRAALACQLLELEREAEARAVFDELAAEGFGALYRDNEWLFGMSLASEGCARLGDRDAAAILYDLLLPFAGRHAMAYPEGSLGAVSRYLGLLAQTLGRLDEAERHFVDGIEMAERMGARPWAAHTGHDLARLLLGRDGPGDRERAADLLGDSLAVARQLGMPALEGRVAALLGDGVSALVGDGAVAGPRPPSVPSRSVFRREGEYWSVAFEGEAFRLHDSKGLRYLAMLLSSPGREIHALDLVGSEEGSAPERSAIGDAGEMLDPKAKGAYRRRLDELREELEEAESWNDPERAARARDEMEFLSRELAGAVGLGGRDRKAAATSERARVNVTRAIKAALVRIADHSPALGRHLETTVRTGTFCAYVPDARVPVDWQLQKFLSVQPE